MKIYKTSWFSRWQKKEKLQDNLLFEAVKGAQKGLFEAELGGGLIKKRIAREGSGKRSGYRTLLATNKGSKWFFIYGFAKNERENIDEKELISFKELSETLLILPAAELKAALKDKALIEVKYDEQKK